MCRKLLSGVVVEYHVCYSVQELCGDLFQKAEEGWLMKSPDILNIPHT